LAGHFDLKCQEYRSHFQSGRHDLSPHARNYLTGLLGLNVRKNIGRIDERLAEANYQGMQQFISDSPWDAAALMRQIGRDAEALLGGQADTALYLDETSFVKKGTASVGVQRQYCGRLGKLENCQVGVFACLGQGQRVALVDFRLFLPESWVRDQARCRKVKIPEAAQRHRTKAELALEMVKQARETGLSHQWIGGDEIYGNNRPLTDALDDAGEVFLMDINRNHLLWDRDPMGSVPPTGAGRGRPPTRRVADPQAVRRSAAAWAEAGFAGACRSVTLRASTRGTLTAKLWAMAVWQWEPADHQARRRWLVVRQEQDGTFKYSLSNAAETVSWERLGYMQAQRFWIERAFQDAKSELGMADYEVRSWNGWHHHMAMVCLALLFAVEERAALAAHLPLLTVRDLIELFEIYLPRRERNQAEIWTAMEQRHQARQRAIDSATKKHQREKTTDGSV
jgi:SRSO17 transposase